MSYMKKIVSTAAFASALTLSVSSAALAADSDHNADWGKINILWLMLDSGVVA